MEARGSSLPHLAVFDNDISILGRKYFRERKGRDMKRCSIQILSNLLISVSFSFPHTRAHSHPPRPYHSLPRCLSNKAQPIPQKWTTSSNKNPSPPQRPSPCPYQTQPPPSKTTQSEPLKNPAPRKKTFSTKATKRAKKIQTGPLSHPSSSQGGQDWDRIQTVGIGRLLRGPFPTMKVVHG